MRKPRDLSGRFQRAEVVGGKLMLTGKWSESNHRDVCISILPQDIDFVRSALDALQAQQEEFEVDRKVLAANKKREQVKRREKRAEVVYAGVKLI